MRRLLTIDYIGDNHTMKRITIIAILLLSPSVFATKYYVNNGTLYGSAGNDANNGTSLATAWLTCRKACTTLVAGDTVLIRGGTYDETSVRNGTSLCGVTVQGGIVPTNNGDSATGRYIVFKGYPGDIRPIMLGRDEGNPPERMALALQTNNNFLIYDSIHFHRGASGIRVGGGSPPHHIIIRNCIIDSTLGCSTDDNNGGITFYLSGYNGKPNGPAQRNFIFENNEVFHNGKYGAGYTDINASGIHSYACDSCIFRNNIIHDSYAGIDIKYGARFSQVYGNTIYNCDEAMMDMFHGTDAAPGGVSYGGPDQVSAIRWHHNLVYRSGVCFTIRSRSTQGSYPDSLDYFYNNTCDCSGPYPTPGAYLNGNGIYSRYGNFNHTYFFNNIIYNPVTFNYLNPEETRGGFVNGIGTAPPVAAYEDYNLFYSSSGVTQFYGFGSTGYTISGWRAASPSGLYGGSSEAGYATGTPGTQGDHDIVTNPLFVDAANRDYRLQTGSPALTAGKGGTFTFSPAYPNGGGTIILPTYMGAVGPTETGHVDTTISISGGSVTEGNNVVFTVTLSSPSIPLAVPLNFAFTTTNGTANANTDFVAQTNQPYAIEAGTLVTYISVQTYTDLLTEGDETFTGTIFSPSLGTILTPSAVGTIVDVPPVPTISGKYLNHWRVH